MNAISVTPLDFRADAFGPDAQSWGNVTAHGSSIIVNLHSGPTLATTLRLSRADARKLAAALVMHAGDTP